MNRLNFAEGGQPLHLGDLAFMQTSLSAPLLTLLASWGNCIIGGCQITINKETSECHTKEGYIYFRGNIYKVNASNLGQVDPSGDFYWLFNELDTEPKTLENGGEVATQTHYRAELVVAREAPTSAPTIADKVLPRLGVDIAPTPRQSYRYEGQGRLVDFRELSKYSAMLTIAFNATDTLPKNGYFATLHLEGVNNMQASWEDDRGENGIVRIKLVNGKLSARHDYEGGGSTSSIGFTRQTYATMLLTWDYEADNGAGAGLNQGIGSTYEGRGRSIHDYGYRPDPDTRSPRNRR